MFKKINGFGDNCISSAPDVLKGTAEQNKAWFDKAVKNVVATAFNALIDALMANDAAGQIGTSEGPLQSVLDALSDEITEKVTALGNTLWSSIQLNGHRTDYNHAFYGDGWTLDNFKPSHNMQPVNANAMFANSTIACDLPAYLNERGVSLDFSKATDIYGSFLRTKFTRIGTVDTRSADTLAWLFYANADLVTIDNLILKSDGSQVFDHTFMYCKNLKNIKITGTIGGDTFALRQSLLLTKESIKSIINAVSKTQNVTIHLNEQAVDKAFDLTDTEWYEFIATRPKCTIVLA